MEQKIDTKLENHIEKQQDFARTIDDSFEKIEADYADYPHSIESVRCSTFKKSLKKTILEKKEQLANGQKIAFTLVDIQNDFVLEKGALGAPGNETTVTRNIALLDAICELVEENPELANLIEIITSQDAHVLNRDINNVDAQIMRNSSYGEAHTLKTIQTEQTELQDINPAEGMFGLHCIVGTKGAAISAPIEARLDALDRLNVAIHRFGKINFSGPEAGMLLKSNVRLDNPMYLDSKNGIYDDRGITYLDFFKAQQYLSVFVTGICGDVCVQQAALGLAELENLKDKITVLDAAVTYLGIPTYDDARSTYVRAYNAKGIKYEELENVRSNPNAPSYYANKTVPEQIKIEDFIKTFNFMDHLQELKSKRDELAKRGNCTDAELALDYLINGLEMQLKSFLPNDDHWEYRFQRYCLGYIKSVKPELEAYREHTIVLNILDILTKLASLIVSVLTLGAAPYFAGKSAFTLFPSVKTDSAKKLEAFEESINLVPVAAQ